MIDPELLELLESTVTIASPNARALDGKRAFGTAVSYRAHVERRNDMIRNASGEEVMAAGRCLLDSYYASIREADRLTLPDGVQPSVVAVEHSYDSNGPYQTVVYW
jgi:hypothetical protein